MEKRPLFGGDSPRNQAEARDLLERAKSILPGVLDRGVERKTKSGISVVTDSERTEDGDRIKDPFYGYARDRIRHAQGIADRSKAHRGQAAKAKQRRRRKRKLTKR